jgi:signal transduction histidine kinase
LKNWRYSSLLKVLAVALGATGMVILFYALLQIPAHQMVLTDEPFEDSYILHEKLQSIQTQVETLAFYYQSYSNVKDGGAIDKADLSERRASMMMDKGAQIEQTQYRYEDWIRTAEEHEDQVEVNRLQGELREQLAAIEEEYSKKLQTVETTLIQWQLNDYREIVARLQQSDTYFYVSLEDDMVFTNLGDNIAGDPDAPFVKPVATTGYASKEAIVNALQEKPGASTISTERGDFFVTLKEDAFKILQQQFEERLAAGKIYLQAAAAGAAAFLLAWLYLLYAAGRRVAAPQEVRLILFDRLYLDVGLVLTLAGIGGCIAILGSLGVIYGPFELAIPGILLVVIGTLLGYLYTTSVAKRLKRHEFWRHTLAAKVLLTLRQFGHKLVAQIHSLFFSGITMRRIAMGLCLYTAGLLTIVILLAFLTGAFHLAGLVVGLALVVGYQLWVLQGVKRYVSGFSEVLHGAERIAADDLTHRIQVTGLGDVSCLGDQINRIAEGLDKAVEREVKAERLKAELISNVSHDLRTPLTAFRTYLDLLKREGLSATDAPAYLEILDEKSLRLQKLIEDLFDAAKASTGNIPVRLERVNLTALVAQSMGELSEGMHASGLNFIHNYSESERWVSADGGLLWRVLENLFSNVFKYAMPHSRVYVEISVQAEDGWCCFVLKNTSSEPLNIPADELLQRFKRGDTARVTEGSGLGLSIAKSLTEIQGGRFTLTVDGDLFKVAICLPQAATTTLPTSAIENEVEKQVVDTNIGAREALVDKGVEA